MKSFNPITQPLSGVHLIEASAGTGKTYSITLLVLRLIITQGFTIDRILVVTFTEAATVELKEKVYQRLSDALAFAQKGEASANSGDESGYEELFAGADMTSVRSRLQNALIQFDRAQIFTIHGFCQRMLFENAFETGMTFGLELQKENDAFFDTLARDFWLAYCARMSPLLIDLFHQSGLGVGKLARLAKVIYSKPDLHVVCKGVSEDGEARYVTAYQTARRLFWECADRLPGVFQVAQGINKRSYNKRYVPGWVAAVKMVFENESPLTVIPDEHALERFSWQRIQSSATGPVQINEVTFFEAVDTLLSARLALAGAVPLLRQVFVDFVRQKLPVRKDQLGVVFFDDLLLDLKRALDGVRGKALRQIVTARYDAALIDEFQDTDATQYGIFKKLFIDESAPFFMIGDPKQAIYAFRGGDIFTYMAAARSVRENTWSLGVNWRSSKDLVCAVNHLFKGPNPFGYEDIRFEPVSPRPDADSAITRHGAAAPGFEFLFCHRSDENSGQKKDGTWKSLSLGDGIHIQRACQDIGNMLNGSCAIDTAPLSPKDIAVLVRTNEQGKQIRDGLLQRGIPASLSQTESVFASVAARELFQILHGIHDSHPALIKTALSTVAMGIKGGELIRLAANSDRLDMWQRHFLMLRQLYENHGIVALADALFKQEAISGDGGLKARLLRKGQQQYLVDFQQLVALLGTTFFARRVPLEQLIDQYGKWLQQLPADDAFARKTDGAADAVQIVTIHKSKGLQYPVVYLPFLFQEKVNTSQDVLLYHDESASNAEVCDLGSVHDDAAILQKEKEDRAENMRLLYVALTRAQYVCKVVFGGFRDMATASFTRLLFGDDAASIAMMDDDALLRGLAQFCQESGAAVRMEGDEGDMMTSDETVMAKSQAPSIKGDSGNSMGPFPAGGSVGLLDNFEPLHFSPFDCVIPASPKGASFSSLVHGKALHNEDDDKWEVASDISSDIGEGAVALSEDNGAYDNGFLGMHPDFGRGPVFGNLVHDIFEQWFRHGRCEDPGNLDGRMTGIIDEALVRYGLYEEMPADELEKWITDILAVQFAPVSLHSGTFCLGDLQGRVVPELEFVMPVEGARFSANALSTAMQVGSDGFFGSYAGELPSLSFPAFHGYLKGFIDLIFEFDSRYYIVDYKTNDLGRRPAFYSNPALQADMATHHYYLQYHLYTVALHRYLQRCLPRYHYDTHFGGIYYLYVRGMSSRAGDTGIVADRPPLARIEALDRLLRDLEGGSA